MPATTSPFFGINYGWTTGESGWGSPINSNFKVLSFLGKGAVDSFVAALPGSPNEGDSVVLTTDNKFYVRIGGAWLFIQPQEGQEVNETSTGKRWQFSGSAWVDATVIKVSTLAAPGGSGLVGDRVSIFKYMTPAQIAEATAGTFATNMTAVVQAAINDGVKHLYFNGAQIYMDTPANMVSGLHIHGPGKIRIPYKSNVTGTGFTYAFKAYGAANAGQAFTNWMTDIEIEGMTFEVLNPVQGGTNFCDVMALRAVNVRGLKFNNNTTSGCGGVWLRHAAEEYGLYNPAGGSATVDPAVTAGFSPTNTDDLNENFEFIGNRIDAKVYQMQAARFHFVKGVRISDNRCSWAAISGWGGNPGSENGGDFQFLRRLMDVSMTGNFVENHQAGLYLIKPQNFTITGNTGKRFLDVFIDVEGGVNGTVSGNSGQNVGNYIYSVFYGAKDVIFTGNSGLQDGSAVNLASDPAFDDAGRFTSQTAERFFADVGTSFNGIDRKDEFTCIGNVFECTGGYPGKIQLNAYSKAVIKGNTLANVCITTMDTSSFVGHTEIKDNTLLFDIDLAGKHAIHVGNQNATKNMFVCDNEITVKVAQTGPTYGIFAEYSATAGDPNIRIKRNTIIQDGGAFTSSIAYKLDSTNIGRRYHLCLEENQVETIANVTAVEGNHFAYLIGNKTAAGDPTVTGDTAPIVGGYIKGTRLPFAADATSANGEGVLADRTGFALPGSAVWAINTAYAANQIVCNPNGGIDRVYKIVTAGTSASSGAGPTGTSTNNITDNTAVWRYIGVRINWIPYGKSSTGAASAVVTTITSSQTYTVPATAKAIRVIGVGAGGPGGGGSSVATSTAASGGGAGGGAGLFDAIFTPAQLTATVAITIATATTGAAGAASGAGAGATGSNGNATSFGAYALAYGGGAGSGGSASTASGGGGGGSSVGAGAGGSAGTGGPAATFGTTGGNGGSSTAPGSLSGGGGGAGCSAVGISAAANYSASGAAGGASGGGFDAGNNEKAGGVGRGVAFQVSVTAGAVGGGNGGNGTNPSGVGLLGSESGAGGGSSVTTAGGKGGNGGYGCGGGGGGAAQTGFAGGQGGNGGQGAMWIIEYY